MAYLLALTILLAPTYILRYDWFGLPMNVLMQWIVVVWAFVFGYLTYTGKILDFWNVVKNIDRVLLVFIGLFFGAGVVSLLLPSVSREKIGQFIVLFLQPISLFFVTYYFVKTKSSSKEIVINAIYLCVGILGAIALLQYFTLWGVPQVWWGNSNEPKRAVSLFAHPNFYALFVTPLLAYAIPDLWKRIQSSNFRARFIYAGSWVLGALGLFLSLSRGGWLGLLCAAIIFVIISANKKLILASLIGLVCLSAIVFATPNLRYRVLLPFAGEKSSVARLSLWNTGIKMVKDSPVLGKGLLGFSNNWYNYNTDPNLDHYPAPHNIVLNFWVDTGILGLLSFLAICVYLLWRGVRAKNNLWLFGFTLFLVAMFVHGLIDIPYFKNDLALVFWILLGLSV
jgi:O-antigen ligase